MQAYFAVYDDQKRLLIFRKKVFGSRFQGKRIARPQVLNGAGQYVLPGGEVDAAEKRATWRAAEREFHEETGETIGNYARRGRATRVLAKPGYHLWARALDARSMESIAREIHGNLANGRTEDDEHQGVYLATYEQARGVLGVRQQLSEEEQRAVDAYARRKRYSQSIDWYREMLTALHKAEYV